MIDGGALLSVVMPVRGGGEWFRLALDSCLAQTYREIELLVVDDGMDDNAKALVATCGAADERIRIVTNRGQGLVSALNTGVGEARGNLVARMDADDFSMPERFCKQADFLEERSDVAVVGCGVRVTGDAGEGFRRYEGWLNGLCAPGTIAAERYVESPMVHPSVLMRRAAVERVDGYRETEWAEDYDLWLRMLEAGYRFAKLDEVLLEWRDSPGRLTRRDDRYSQDSLLRVKAHFLGRMDQVRARGVAIAGAGPIGKRMGVFLREEGVTVVAFYDVHPRRIGERIGGVPVLSDDELKASGSEVLLGAVGIRGQREKVRGAAMTAGYVEGEDFFCVA